MLWIEKLSINFTEVNCSKYILLKSKIQWEAVSSTVIFVIKDLKDVIIDDNFLFEEIRKVNTYLNEEILKKCMGGKVSMHKMWVENIFAF